ncbi:MAG: ABC transporter ATP-binding protein, partial [Clostridia bacterium]|nr:ABC transporter ATP-binding protein [Clostridia bacterium]
MNETVIEIKDVCFKHKQAENSSIINVNLSINRGECVLICGESGSGKTTITRLINGLIPHYYEGELKGDVNVFGMDTAKSELYKMAKHVGSVFQNPRSQFFCVDTTSELAFGCENMGLPEDEIRERVKAVTDEMNINYLLSRSIFDLSGGEKQKIACGSVCAVHPDIFVLDEPTSNLDLKAIEDLRETLKIWKAAGKTIVIAEHRIYWLKDICDRVICMDNGAVKFDMRKDQFCKFTDKEFQNMGLRSIHEAAQMPNALPIDEETNFMTLCNFNYSYYKESALNIDELKLPTRAIIAVTGLNGAGKSTFATFLCGIQSILWGL